MAIGCGAKCSKFMLIVFNFIFWLSGAALLGIGIWLRVDPTILKLQDLISISTDDQYLNYIAYFLIGVGAFVFLVGFLGCCGAIKESRCMLGMYIFFMVLIMGAEIAAGVLAIVYKAQIEKELNKSLATEIKEKFEETNAIGAAMGYTQLYFDCCGVSGQADYVNSKFSNMTSRYDCCGVEGVETYNNSLFQNTTKKLYPVTCCKARTKDYANFNNTEWEDQTCLAGTNTDLINDKGCLKALEGWFSSHATMFIGIGIGIACLELFGFIFAICLCRNVGEEE
ncbi:unnamed protein product [Owenia fusiformis]|uniref:Tetraspanin n=1 Tax=Owenia fusiformis TaxID=6347 RepID=A0A8S4NZ05_OWEFU|nr:unnamed protein product [Owenia fusiformis]